MLDFSPLAVRRERFHQIDRQGQYTDIFGDRQDEVTVKVVDEPTILPKRKIWKEDVVTRLPFCEVIRHVEIPANGVMMDDQRVIIVCVSLRWPVKLCRVRKVLADNHRRRGGGTGTGRVLDKS
jgi:hypothetical protein